MCAAFNSDDNIGSLMAEIDSLKVQVGSLNADKLKLQKLHAKRFLIESYRILLASNNKILFQEFCKRILPFHSKIRFFKILLAKK